MKRLAVAQEDRRSITEWFEIWGRRVGDVNFRAVREMFTEDAIAFGSKVEMVTSREALERDQWRAIWPTIENYAYDLGTLEIVVSPDRLMAMGASIFHSTGIHKDGTRFKRTGRATVTLQRELLAAPWFCNHSHVSLTPGTPTPSYGKRVETV